MKVGEEKLWQNWGHYAKLCSRQKCTFVSLQIYHESLPLTMHSVEFATFFTHFKSNINIIWKFLIGCCLWSYFRCQTFLQIKLRGWLFWFWNEGWMRGNATVWEMGRKKRQTGYWQSLQGWQDFWPFMFFFILRISSCWKFFMEKMICLIKSLLDEVWT